MAIICTFVFLPAEPDRLPCGVRESNGTRQNCKSGLTHSSMQSLQSSLCLCVYLCSHNAITHQVRIIDQSNQGYWSLMQLSNCLLALLFSSPALCPSPPALYSSPCIVFLPHRSLSPSLPLLYMRLHVVLALPPSRCFIFISFSRALLLSFTERDY